MKTLDVSLTRPGRKTVEEGLSLDQALIMEILAKVKHVELENILDLMEELEAHFGSTENAIAAVKSGAVGFKQGE